MKIQIKFTYYCSAISIVVVNFLTAGIWFLQHTDNNFSHATMYQLVVIILINILFILVAAYFISRHAYAIITPKYIEFNELFKKGLYRWDTIKKVEHKIFLNFQYITITANNNEVFKIPLSCTNQQELEVFIKVLENDNSFKKCILGLDYFNE